MSEADRIRQKTKGRGEVTMTEEELTRYRSLEGDARIIAFKTISADLQKRSGLLTGKYGEKKARDK